MIYSVWNPAARVYDYYETAEARPTHAGTPGKASGGSVLGVTPEQAAWRLPPGARKTGQGVLPKGRVASLGGVDAELPSWWPWAAAAAAFVAWRMTR